MAEQRGFSLIELLVVVAVIGILAAVAYPSYQAYIIRAARADAKAVLAENSAWLERNYTSNGCYSKSGVAACANQSGSDVTLPIAQSPKSGTANYAISVAFSNSGQNYALSAAPTGNFSDAECGTLGLNQAGAQSISGSGNVSTCWQK